MDLTQFCRNIIGRCFLAAGEDEVDAPLVSASQNVSNGFALVKQGFNAEAALKSRGASGALACSEAAQAQVPQEIIEAHVPQDNLRISS